VFVGGDAFEDVQDNLADFRRGHSVSPSTVGTGVDTPIAVATQDCGAGGRDQQSYELHSYTPPSAAGNLRTMSTELIPSMPSELFRMVAARSSRLGSLATICGR